MVAIPRKTPLSFSRCGLGFLRCSFQKSDVFAHEYGGVDFEVERVRAVGIRVAHEDVKK